MKNIWNEQEAAGFGADLLKQRVYSSRLLGREPSLVLHGGGNTSVKQYQKNLFGESEHLLLVKGSGWDLATIEDAGFAPVRMETLLRMANLEKLSDSDMVRVQKSAMTNPNAPAPSVEAILHAIIPFAFVDHTHADAVVAITNTPGGEDKIRQVYGDRVLYIPYVMPGFILARKVYELTRDVDWKRYEGMVLLNHGIFSFADTAKESYDRMISLVNEAEEFLKSKNAIHSTTKRTETLKEDLKTLAYIRQQMSKKIRSNVIIDSNRSDEAMEFVARKDVASLATRGPLTPDHVLHTKRLPWILDGEMSFEKAADGLNQYEKEYLNYFAKNSSKHHQCLDPAPRWAVWPGHGVLSFGVSVQKAKVVSDIARHTVKTTQWAEALAGWVALPEKDIFEVEYWELEQAKLKKSGGAAPLQGKIALVTGAASGIGKACVDSLCAQGAAVVALDIKPEVLETWKKRKEVSTLVCDVTDRSAVDEAVAHAVRTFGGLDIVVANAGIFPPSQKIESIENETWARTIDINLTSQMYLMRACVPFLALGAEPTIIVIASKNVPAPGPGAASYSVSKAALTQLARVAALELGPMGIRVNMLHPHAVMDTALWTPEVLESRAKSYKMTVEEYKRNNLLRVEIRTQDVADLVTSMAGPLYSKITGAQLIVDGGHDRTI